MLPRPVLWPDYPAVPERLAEALHYSASDMALEVNAGGKRQDSRTELSALRIRFPSPLLKRDEFTQFGQEACRLTGARPDQSGRLQTAAGNVACSQRPRPALNAGVLAGGGFHHGRVGVFRVFIPIQRQQETQKWLENVGACCSGDPCRLKPETVLSFAFFRVFMSNQEINIF